MKIKNGFTMIELMVVMAILASLMTMGIATYTRSMQRGRDAKRIEDMKEIQKGFELYYANNDVYRDCQGTMGVDPTVFPAGLPQPPAGGLLYSYNSIGAANNCGTATYCVCAQLENPNDYGNSTGNLCDSYTTVRDPANLFYCVNSVQ